MRLFGKLKKKSGSTKQMQNTGNTDERLDKNGKLPFGWYSQHNNEIKSWEEKMVSYAVFGSDSHNKVDERIAAYHKLIELYEEKKAYFLSAGECYAKYFTDTWMHCHNSKYSDFEYVNLQKDYLEQLEEKRDDLVKREQLVHTLDNNLLAFLQENNEVLQADVYKAFDLSLKSDIQERLHIWEKEGKIERIKQGRSYLIRVQ